MNTIDRRDLLCRVPASRAAPWAGWWRRLWRRLTEPAAASRRNDDDLVELDAHTLADIGAPDRLLARAMARREVQRQEREGLRVGLASGAWHHW